MTTRRPGVFLASSAHPPFPPHGIGVRSPAQEALRRPITPDPPRHSSGLRPRSSGDGGGRARADTSAPKIAKPDLSA